MLALITLSAKNSGFSVSLYVHATELARVILTLQVKITRAKRVSLPVQITSYTN